MGVERDRGDLELFAHLAGAVRPQRGHHLLSGDSLLQDQRPLGLGLGLDGHHILGGDSAFTMLSARGAPQPNAPHSPMTIAESPFELES